MLYRYALCAVAFCSLLTSHAVAQGGDDSNENDQELAEIRRTLGEMSEVLSRMAVTLDRIDDSLKHRQSGLGMPATQPSENARMLPILFPPDVERTMIHEGKVFHRKIQKLNNRQDAPQPAPRSVLEPPRRTLEPPLNQTPGLRRPR